MANATSVRTRSIAGSGDRAMVYICECGKKWSEPPAASGGDEKHWKCNCGRDLAMRDRVIFQGAVRAEHA